MMESTRVLGVFVCGLLLFWPGCKKHLTPKEQVQEGNRAKLCPDLNTWAQCERHLHAQCRDSEACSSMGQCFYEDGACVVGSDEDCRQSKICQLDGDCRRFRLNCAPGSAEDCEQSYACRRFGNCKYVEESAACVCEDDCDTRCRRYRRP